MLFEDQSTLATFQNLLSHGVKIKICRLNVLRQYQTFFSFYSIIQHVYSFMYRGHFTLHLSPRQQACGVNKIDLDNSS